jgi:L-lactate dehydrogenase complex protein LldG
MSSRDEILKTITANKPAFTDLPVIAIEQVISFESLTAQFRETLERIGGKVEYLDHEELLQDFITKRSANQPYVINTQHLSESEREEIKSKDSYALAAVDLACIRGTLAIAENGSIWVDENQMVNRLLPFICQHLIIVLNADDFVATMHHAYERINVAETGFGAFIAGPSKTADIEQSLVIGAHGARSLTVVVIG